MLKAELAEPDKVAGVNTRDVDCSKVSSGLGDVTSPGYTTQRHPILYGLPATSSDLFQSFSPAAVPFG